MFHAHRFEECQICQAVLAMNRTCPFCQKISEDMLREQREKEEQERRLKENLERKKQELEQLMKDK
jgi:hypothetical protein